MKGRFYIAIILLFFFSCKREPLLIEPPEPFCSGAVFRTTFNMNFEPVSIAEDKDGHILIAGHDGNSLNIIKLNPVGELSWHLTNTGIPGKAGEMVTTSDNSILVASYEENIIQTGVSDYAFNNVYIQYGIQNKSPCNPVFTMDYTDTSSVRGKSYLSMLDAGGHLKWTKAFNDSYSYGKCLAVANDNSIFYLTVSLYGRRPEPRFDSWGVFTDTVLYPMNRNTLNLYHLDCNGNILQKFTVDSIFNAYHDISPKIDFALSSDNIIFKTADEIIVLDKNGGQPYRFLTNPAQCSNLITSMVVNTEGVIIVSEKYNLAEWGTVYVHYTRRFDVNGTAIWTQIEEKINTDIKGDRFLAITENTISVCDISGQSVYSITEAGIKCTMLNCNKGVTYVVKVPGQLTVCRTNSNGGY